MSDEPLKPRVCAKTGCGRPATHFVGLLLRPPRRFGDAEIRTYIDMVLCPDCASTASVNDLVSDEGWAQIVEGIRRAGKMKPERGRTSSFSEPIDEGPDFFRDRYEPAAGKGRG